MSIYRPKGSKIWWYEFQFAGQRIRESTKSRSKTLAVDAERNRRRELENAYNGIRKRASAKLFTVAAEEWLEIKKPTWAAASFRIEKDNLKHVRPFFDRRLVSDITGKDIAEYQRTRIAANAAPKTINLEVGTIRSILRRNNVWSAIQQDVRMLPVHEDVGKALSFDEERALIEACLSSRSRSLYLAVTIALHTAMRYSEIRLLLWKQINLSAKTIVVGRSKTESGSGRIIPINATLLSVLQIWADQFPARDSEHYVFPSERYGAGTDSFTNCVYATDPNKPINDWKEAWEGAKKRAGTILKLSAPDVSSGKKQCSFSALQCRFHDLRHTACTRLLEGGVPYPVVSAIMGWSAATAIRMAKRYGHIGQKAMKDAMELLSISAAVQSASPKNPPQFASQVTGKPH